MKLLDKEAKLFTMINECSASKKKMNAQFQLLLSCTPFVYKSWFILEQNEYYIVFVGTHLKQ